MRSEQILETEQLPPGWMPLDYKGRSVVCPVINHTLPDDPRDLVGLVKYRARLYQECHDDMVTRRNAYQTAKKDFAWWCNAFAWTPSGFRFTDEMKQVNQDLAMMAWRHWPVNDALDAKYDECKELGRSMMLPKSRDMRATLYFVLRYSHNLLFRNNWYGLMIAHKFELVDGKSMEGLMPRVRRVLGFLPPWMTHDAEGNRVWKSKLGLIHNMTRNNMIAGAASTQEPATGQRPSEVLFDEAAKNPNFSVSYDQTAAASKNRWVVSSYKGPERFSQLDQEGIEVFPILYYNHPNKGLGRRHVTNTNPFYPVKVGKRFVWSPWFHREVWDEMKQAPVYSTTLVGTEILADKSAGSSGFFDGDVLSVLSQRAKDNPPTFDGSMLFPEASPEREADIVRRKPGMWRLTNTGRTFRWWGDLPGHRPIQDRTYAIFADISQGRGESNSVAAVVCVNERRICGMYAVSDFDPAEFIRHCVMLGLWVGGKGGENGCLLGWEVNGPGEGLDRELRRLKYPRLWSATGDELGWRSDGGAKEEAAYQLSIALQRDELRVDDTDFYREAADWAYLTSSTVGCVKTSKDHNAKATHGDRVIAVMGANLMLRSIGPVKMENSDLPGYVDRKLWAEQMKQLGHSR